MTENLSLLSLTLTPEVVKTRLSEASGLLLYYPLAEISEPAPTKQLHNSTV